MKKPTQFHVSPAEAFDAMAALHRAHPGLPDAYTHLQSPSQVDVQVPSFSALEAWREALGVDTDVVRLSVHGDATTATVAFPAVAGPVRVRVYTVAQDLLPAPVDEAVAA